MFTCSICDETFVDEDTTYATPCGHVFHYKCIEKWLERSNTCPHCRLEISKNVLMKLFLQVDPNVRDKKTEEEIYSLKDELKNARNKEHQHLNSIFRLKTEIQQVISQNQQNRQDIYRHELESIHDKSQIEILKKQIVEFTAELSFLGDQIKNLEVRLKIEIIKKKEMEKDLYELQSTNTVTIDKLKSEIADLKSEKAYFQNKCYSLESGNDILPSTSKVIFENKEDSLHTIPRQNEFYGHNPHLKLSSKQFLFGCVFFFIENKIHNYEDICNDTSMSKLNVIENGGRVDDNYSDRVTHLICVTQKDELVKLGIKAGKRCVTEYWLSDVVAKRKMLPPWLAHHFPTPYSEKTGLPCQQHKVAIANFDVNKYQIVKTMVELTGAQVDNEVSSTTDVVVSLKLEGELVEKALTMKKPVVNVQWLNDVLFGAQIGLKFPTSIMYQDFNLSDPFKVNYTMVSRLMDAWKTPVVFLKSPLVFDLTDCPDRSCKRRKTVVEIPEIINLDDEDDDDDSDDIAIISISSNDNKIVPLVMFCGFSINEEKELKKKVLYLGGKLADHNEGTHLIMKEPTKTMKFLLCISSVTFIIKSSWLLDSYSTSTFLNELNYCVSDVYDESHSVVCHVPEILKIPTRKDLFKNLYFHVLPRVRSMPVIDLQKIISSAGGIVEHEIRSLYTIHCLPVNSYIIVIENNHAPIVKLPYAVYIDADTVCRSIMQQIVPRC